MKELKMGHMGEKATRYNEGKRKWSLVHWKSIEPMVEVLEFGAMKYSPNNWKKGLDKREILESMMRHLAALIDGEETDPESLKSHMGHIMCNGMFYNYFNKKEDKVSDGDFQRVVDPREISDEEVGIYNTHKDVVIESLVDLIDKYPNDAQLGALVRNLRNSGMKAYENLQLEKEMD